MNFEDELKQKVQETEKTVYEFLPEEEFMDFYLGKKAFRRRSLRR